MKRLIVVFAIAFAVVCAGSVATTVLSLPQAKADTCCIASICD